ncbi:hypothetical protein [Brevibacillus laterosporus]|uniref:hypothetical protein n=1 Tax=Brevibacillus laterosporus TaxID=1465 RepID=UPI0014439250|nr:hypothetical protein [Brevibacillus laterosporus]NKQ21304.1 hypothetical protein [Brevibacillus laterosporus]WNX31402.1 hypothetical protein RWW94_00610 [Brevibacillus laterosporus]
MNNNAQRFLKIFRDLESKEFTPSQSEEKRLLLLKQKLVHTPLIEEIEVISKVIIIISLYPSTGSSFIAGNYAWLSSQKRKTTLCEHPLRPSYYYTALDMEAKKCFSQNTPTKIRPSNQVAYLENERLLICVDTSIKRKTRKIEMQMLSDLFTLQKQSSLLLVDLSSFWREEGIELLMQWADEVWITLDTNISRLAQLICTEDPPVFWNDISKKCKYILNRWNYNMTEHALDKQIEGTLSLWNKDSRPKKIDCYISQMCADKVIQAQLQGRFYCELFTEHSDWFELLYN